MVLYYRLLKMFLRLFFDRSKVNPGAPFSREFTVRFTDLDIFGHMTNSRYFAFMDLVRIEYLLRSGFYELSRKNKYLGFAGLLTARFRKQLKRGETFKIVFSLAGYTDKAIYNDVKFIKDGVVHCHAIEKQMIHAPGKGIIPPTQLFEMMGLEKPDIKHPEYIKKMIETDRAMEALDKENSNS